MLKRYIVLTALVTISSLSLGHAQDSVARVPGAVYDFDKKGEKSGPAPKRDISGIREPAGGPGDAIQANGAKAMPSDGKPEHELPFTSEGMAAFKAHKPGFGTTVSTECTHK